MQRDLDARLEDADAAFQVEHHRAMKISGTSSGIPPRPGRMLTVP